MIQTAEGVGAVENHTPIIFIGSFHCTMSDFWDSDADNRKSSAEAIKTGNAGFTGVS